jgi:glycine hydroxymethyltransferase
MTGKRAQELLDRVGITANKNSVPFDERPPTIASGLRLGTPAMTTRGFGPEEMREVTQIILGTLTAEPTEANLDRFLQRSRELTAAFPLYHSLGV